MKLLFCQSCNDIFRLWSDQPSRCRCGASSGMYQPNCVHASYSGPAVPLGISNGTFQSALERKDSGGPYAFYEREFKAFVIEKDCPTFVHIGGDETID